MIIASEILALRQIVFFVWVTLNEHKWVISRERRGQGDVLDIPALPTHPPVRSKPVTLAEAERDHILKALEESHGVVGGVSGAAARLGVPRTTLTYKMRRCGISREMR